MMNRNMNLLIYSKILKNEQLKFICLFLIRINFDLFMIF